jgi:hypothetical protein
MNNQRLAELAGIVITEAVDVNWTKSRLDTELANISTSLEQITLKTDRLRRSATSTSDDTADARHLEQLLQKTTEVSNILAGCQRTISDVISGKFSG